MELDPATMLRCIAILCTIELQSVQPVGQRTTEIGWLLFRPTGRTEKCTFVLQVGRLDVLSLKCALRRNDAFGFRHTDAKKKQAFEHVLTLHGKYKEKNSQSSCINQLGIHAFTWLHSTYSKNRTRNMLFSHRTMTFTFSVTFKILVGQRCFVLEDWSTAIFRRVLVKFNVVNFSRKSNNIAFSCLRMINSGGIFHSITILLWSLFTFFLVLDVIQFEGVSLWGSASWEWVKADLGDQSGGRASSKTRAASFTSSFR